MYEGNGVNSTICEIIKRPKYSEDCTEEIIKSPMNTSIVMPTFLNDFIKWNDKTGELKCTEIKTDSEEFDSSNGIIKIKAMTEYFEIQTIVSYNLTSKNNHAPEFIQDKLTIGFPNFVFLNALPYPIYFMEASDADRKPTNQLSFTVDNQYFYVDQADKGLYYHGPNDYLDTKVDMKITVHDGLFQDDLELELIPLDQDKIIPLKLKSNYNQNLINNLNDQYKTHHFRLLSDLNNGYIYITIQTITNYKITQDSFLTRFEAEKLLENSDTVEITDEIEVEVPDTTDSSSAYMPVAIVFIVLFCLLLAGNVSLLVYFRHQRKNGQSNSSSRNDLVNVSEDRFSDTFARNNYIKNQIEAQNQLEAPELSDKIERKISFNENAEVIDSDEEDNSTSL